MNTSGMSKQKSTMTIGKKAAKIHNTSTKFFLDTRNLSKKPLLTKKLNRNIITI